MQDCGSEYDISNDGMDEADKSVVYPLKLLCTQAILYKPLLRLSNTLTACFLATALALSYTE